MRKQNTGRRASRGEFENRKGTGRTSGGKSGPKKSYGNKRGAEERSAGRYEETGRRSERPTGKYERINRREDDSERRGAKKGFSKEFGSERTGRRPSSERRSDRPFKKDFSEERGRTSASDISKGFGEEKRSGRRMTSERKSDSPFRKNFDDERGRRSASDRSKDFSEEKRSGGRMTSAGKSDTSFRKNFDDERESGRRNARETNADQSFRKDYGKSKSAGWRSEEEKGERPFKKRYPDADKSEEGWTKADGTPLRRRSTQKTGRRNDDRRPPGDFSKSRAATGDDKRSSRTAGERKKNKSFIRSGYEDTKPFERFEIKSGREKRRTAPVTARREEPRSDIPAGGLIRLNRFLSNAGICSRREADEFIEAGLVSVNGKIVTELGTKVSLSDDVRYNGERLKAEKNVYVLLNKPKDYITTVDDPGGRKTVMELIERACKERVYPVGRLDRNTTGVLLFTNDGDLAKKLTHPSSNIRKVYHAELNKSLKKGDMQQMIDGVELDDGVAAVDEIAYDAGGDKSQVGLELHSGKNRIVRRMFEHLGYEVKKLDRVMFAGLTKKDLPRGRWRILTEVEVASLKMLTGKGNKKGEKKGRNQLTLF